MKLAFYPRDSLVHSLDPRSKLLFVFTCFIAVLFVNGPVSYVLLSLLIAIPFLFSKLPPGKVFKGLTPFLILFLLTFLFHLFLTPGKILFKLGGLNGTLEGLYKGLFYSVRIFLLVLSAILFGFTTSPFDLADSLSNFFFRFKSETLREIPMIMIFVFRFIPFMFREGKRAVMAHKARCGYVRLGRDIFSLIFPVIHSSIRRAEQLALGLHAKAYQVGEKRTTIKEFRFSSNDYYFMGYSILPLIVVIFVR
ncbi:energy-coupling factor transporter transmembrane protein EcfT [candidate division WOR-3 bacterium]|nr:energy-coupling factor transporter transmembrane protein EcfT [candidate division WOR-3 bacterium]